MSKIFALLLCLCIKFVYANLEIKEQLPGHVEPILYDLKITPNANTSIFYGKVVIHLKIKISTKTVKLHCKNLKIIESKLTEENEQTFSTHLNQTKDYCTVIYFRPLNPGANYSLTLKFEGELKENSKGLYRIPYEVEGKKKWLIATNLRGNYAREVFPCFDEPRFRTPFTISIARRPEQKVFSNMDCSRSYKHSDGNLVWSSCSKTPPLPTHKVAFLVTHYSVVHDKPIGIWSRPNMIENVEYALQQSNRALKQLENFINITYMAPKLEIIITPGEIPRVQTENWGLFVFTEMQLVSAGNKTSELQQEIITTSLSRQIAHHWFESQVTPVAWEYMWLTEAFTGYMEYLMTSLIEPSWKIDSTFNVAVLQPVLWAEITNEQALTSLVNNQSPIIRLKGTSIIRMLEHIISRESLRSVIQKYLTDSQKLHKGSVTPQDLFDALKYQNTIDSFPLPSNISIVDVMKTWTENNGYPLINVTRNYRSGTVEIEQYSYTLNQATTSSSPDPKWIIPISYTTKSKASFSSTAPSEWLHTNNMSLSINIENKDWIILNLQQIAYYRVNYDRENWDLLIAQLKEDMTKIHFLNRAQLLDDAFTLASNNELPFDIPLKLAYYLQNETEIVPILSAIFHLNMLHTKYEDTESYQFIKLYIQSILRNQIQLSGFKIKSTDDHLAKTGKTIILSLACKIGLTSCVQGALQEFNSNIEDLSQVHPDLKEVVFSTALRESEDLDTVYEKLLSAYHASDIAYEKIIILRSFGCVKNETLLNRILSKVFGEKEFIGKLDEDHIYDSILSSSDGITILLKFIHERIFEIEDMENNELQTLKKLLYKLESQVQTTQHKKTLDKMRHEFDKLDQNYSILKELFQHARSSAKERVKTNNKNSDILKPIIQNVLHIPSIHVPIIDTQNKAAIAHPFCIVLLSFYCIFLSFITYFR